MMDLTVKELIDLGTSAMLLVFVAVLWRRVGQLTDTLVETRKEVVKAAAKVAAVAAAQTAKRDSQDATH